MVGTGDSEPYPPNSACSSRSSRRTPSMQEEGYVFKEWREAVDRAARILGRRFIVPVIVDDDYAGDPSRYRQMSR